MCRLFCAVLIFLTFILHQSTAYKWITLNSNDSIPGNAIRLSDNPLKYVGRATHYNLVLHAEIYNSTYAVTLYDSNELVKDQFEVLVPTEHCEWQKFLYFQNTPDNVVRAGTAWNGEPMYVGKTETYSNETNISSILLGSQELIEWEYNTRNRYALVCDDDTTWIDVSTQSIPKNAVYGGNFDGDDCYVSRVLGPFSFVPGNVCYFNKIAKAVFGGHEIQSRYCQVLVGDPNKQAYSWYKAYNGEIPDYAVIGGRSKNGEFMYIARLSDFSLTYIVHSDVLASPRKYFVLVKKDLLPNN